ncbi:MAG: DUF5683 domain-containing protein [Longimicrobiaceae bacterium]
MRIRPLALAGGLLLLLLAIPEARLAAQDPLPTDTIVRDTVPAAPDTVPTVLARRSPRGAFVRSLLIPGWGQAWVGAPGRGGVYFAMEAGSLWMVYKSWQRLREAREQQAWLRETGRLQPTQESALVQSREAQREDWLAVALFLVFFSGADAFVAAHLADFDEHIGVIPTSGGGLRLEARVPVGGRR